jgi:hypothetical protein
MWEGLKQKIFSPERESFFSSSRYLPQGISKGGAYGSEEESQEEKEKVTSMWGGGGGLNPPYRRR